MRSSADPSPSHRSPVLSRSPGTSRVAAGSSVRSPLLVSPASGSTDALPCTDRLPALSKEPVVESCAVFCSATSPWLTRDAVPDSEAPRPSSSVAPARLSASASRPWMLEPAPSRTTCAALAGIASISFPWGVGERELRAGRHLPATADELLVDHGRARVQQPEGSALGSDRPVVLQDAEDQRPLRAPTHDHTTRVHDEAAERSPPLGSEHVVVVDHPHHAGALDVERGLVVHRPSSEPVDSGALDDSVGVPTDPAVQVCLLALRHLQRQVVGETGGELAVPRQSPRCRSP